MLQTALHYATETLKLPPERIVLYGESLGSGVAVRMAMDHPASALILEAPYTSVVDRSAELYPFIPARLLVQDTYPSLSRIAQVTCPLLILHGEKDHIIPARHGRMLFAAANEPKHAVFFPSVGHSDFDWQAVIREMNAFLASQNRLPLPH